MFSNLGIRKHYTHQPYRPYSDETITHHIVSDDINPADRLFCDLPNSSIVVIMASISRCLFKECH